MSEIDDFARAASEIRPPLWVWRVGAVVHVAITELSGTTEIKRAKELAQALNLATASDGDDELTAFSPNNNAFTLRKPAAGTFSHEYGE